MPKGSFDGMHAKSDEPAMIDGGTGRRAFRLVVLPIAVGILNFPATYVTSSTGRLAAGSRLAVLPAILLVALQRFIVAAWRAR